jgi:hypothetical protein
MPRRAAASLAIVTLAVVLPGGSRFAAAVEKVPDVTLGPGSADAARRVDADIAEVTVFSDRARVRRRGRAPSGTRLVRFPDLPGATFIDTVRVSTSAGRIIRVEAVPVERERLSIADAAKLLDQLDAANDSIVALEDRARLDQWEVDLLTRLAPAAPVPEEKREGRKGPPLDAGAWWRALDFVTGRADAARARLARVADERRDLTDKRDRVLAELGKLNQGGFAQRAVQVVAVLEAAGSAPLDLELEYFLPGAHWKPVYDLHFAPARGQVRLETAAVVVQATGEDWQQAALSFSTAIPGRGIDLPELLTWTLGERGEFVPQMRPRVTPPVAPTFPPPAIAPVRSDAEALQAELVRQRLAHLSLPPVGGELIATNKDQVSGKGSKQTEMDEDHDGIPDDQDFEPGEPPPAPPPSPRFWGGRKSPLASAPAVSRRVSRDVMAEESEDVNGYAEAPAPSSYSYRAPPRVVPLALSEPLSVRRPPSFSDPYLPAVSAGGLDYVYRAPTPSTIASSGKEIHIPLASQTFSTAAFYQATPALATTAFLRARVRNDGKRPLLRGPAAIFSDGELVGQGELETTGPGGNIELPLGADQDIRLVRQVHPSTRTTGVIIKSDETTYDVQIQVGNYKKQPAVIEVIDQVPRAARGDVEVKALASDPAVLGPPDADGVVRWRLELPPGGTRTIWFRYQIVRPKDWKLYQR